MTSFQETTQAPPPAPSVQVTRPDGTLAKGQYAAPAWLVAIIGVALVAAVGSFFWLRHRRHKKQQEEAMPHSSPMSSRR